MAQPPVDQRPSFPALLPPERYCSRCQAPLPVSSAANTCIACGHGFDPDNAANYLIQRAFSPVIFWFPAFCLAVGIGTIVYSLWWYAGGLFTGTAFFAQLLNRPDAPGDVSNALLLALVVACPAILGYGTGRAACFLGSIAILVGLALFVAGHPAGILLVFVHPLFVLFVGLVMAGVELGALLRIVLLSSAWNHRWFFPASAGRSHTMPPEHLSRPSDASRPLRRHPLQFRLKGLLAFVGALAMMLTMIGPLQVPPLWLAYGMAMISAAALQLIVVIHLLRFRRL